VPHRQDTLLSHFSQQNLPRDFCLSRGIAKFWKEPKLNYEKSQVNTLRFVEVRELRMQMNPPQNCARETLYSLTLRIRRFTTAGSIMCLKPFAAADAATCQV
jgi:hypothetical protein